jgi:hypothetical protein
VSACDQTSRDIIARIVLKKVEAIAPCACRILNKKGFPVQLVSTGNLYTPASGSNLQAQYQHGIAQHTLMRAPVSYLA